MHTLIVKIWHYLIELGEDINEYRAKNSSFYNTYY